MNDAMGCQGHADRISKINCRLQIDDLRKIDERGAADAITTTKILFVLFARWVELGIVTYSLKNCRFCVLGTFRECRSFYACFSTFCRSCRLFLAGVPGLIVDHELECGFSSQAWRHDWEDILVVVELVVVALKRLTYSRCLVVYQHTFTV
jgi:hypothetical protein